MAVGRLKSGPELALFEEYRERFDRLAGGLGLKPLTLFEIADGDGRDREGERVLGKLPAGGGWTGVRLDEHGEMLTSVALAQRLARWRDDGMAQAVFLIGGAEGHGAGVSARVPNAMALGPQTWPHRLVRVMIAEQLYRAATLLAGTPYHKA
jgi:23S rRNA (pseudouridine1915-N3)-methyltransferase